MRCQFHAKRDSMRRNLRTLYGRARAADFRDGLTWYPNARAIVNEWAVSYRVAPDTVACVVAAISPQCDWNRNLVIANDVLQGGGISIGGAIRLNIDKARRILHSDNRAYDSVDAIMRAHFPTGPKVNAFARNLAGDVDAVTVDGHASQAALNDVNSRYRLPWTPYGIFADCYRDVAHDVKLAPCDFQAIIWHVWKGLYPAETKRRILRESR